MDVVISVFTTLFGLLTDNTIFNIPLLVWFLLPAVIILAVKFIQGKK